MNFPIQRHSPPGFTLVEIMVSMLIALIVMGGVYRTLTDESVEHERSEKILDMQNNARVVLGRLTRDVRRTGFLGCDAEQAANTLSNQGTDATQFGKYTVAVDAGGVQLWTANKSILSTLIDNGVAFDYLGEALGFSNDAPDDHPLYQPGTDALTLVYLTDERAVDEAAPMTAGTDDITLKSPGFDQDDILYVTDCADFSLFQKTNGKDIVAPFTVAHAVAGLNANNNLVTNYGQLAMARVFRLTSETYFVHKGKYTLNLNADNAQIASNIEDLQFEFLFDELNDDDLTNDVWVTTLGAHTSKEVRAVRIWVLAMSDTDFTYTDTDNYNYPNSPYCSAAQAAIWAADTDPLTSCRGTGTPASLAPASPANGAHRHRFLASTVVYLRNIGL